MSNPLEQYKADKQELQNKILTLIEDFEMKYEVVVRDVECIKHYVTSLSGNDKGNKSIHIEIRDL